MSIDDTPALAITSLDELYDTFDRLSVEGGWHRKREALWAEPRKNFVPYIWHYRDIKPVLDAAGPLVDHSMADRRNVTLTNPIEGNTYATVRTLVGAYQMIRPGEVAKAHRHTPAALRIILEGEGTYTVVEGKRVEMRPGDVLLTPSFLWHEHAYDGAPSADCYWVDVLDVPLVHLLEPMFFERHATGTQPDPEDLQEAPIAFRHADTMARLDAAQECAHGMAHREVELGAPAMPTVALHVQRMSAGFASATARTTANSIFTVLEGEGVTTVDGVELEWSAGDVFAVPCWRPYQHRVSADAHLVRASDEPVMRSLGLLRWVTT
jgi:gentisate 1,2-dioxygenase